MVNIDSKLKVDDIIEVKIESISQYGKFIGRYYGVVVFIESNIRAYPLEKVKVKIINIGNNCAHAAIVEGGTPI